jgi:argininosuccinate lyase
MELVRGKAGRVFGHLTALLTTMKGLPLAYNKDMQEDKEAVFGTADTVLDCLRVSETVLRNLRVSESRTGEAATRGYLNATELADYLARKGMPFRQAHEMAGRIVMRAIESGSELDDLPLDQFKSFSPLIGDDVYKALSLKETLATKSQTGGTGPDRVAEALIAARKELIAD